MKNTNYYAEMVEAQNFVVEHNTDAEFLYFMTKIMGSDMTHSERLSEIYHFMKEHYPAATVSLITGLAYWSEN